MIVSMIIFWYRVRGFGFCTNNGLFSASGIGFCVLLGFEYSGWNDKQQIFKTEVQHLNDFDGPWKHIRIPS